MTDLETAQRLLDQVNEQRGTRPLQRLALDLGIAATTALIQIAANMRLLNKPMVVHHHELETKELDPDAIERTVMEARRRSTL